MSFEYLRDLFEYRDGKLYWKVARSNIKPGDRAGTPDKLGYRSVLVDKKPIKEHRITFFLHHGFMPETVDHIDGNPANNRIENLRAATLSENCFNRRICCRFSSGG